MRSSEALRGLGHAAVLLIATALSGSIAGCARAPSPVGANPTCILQASSATPEQNQAAMAWRSSVESGPLYAAAVAASPVTACELRTDADGQITLAYRLRDGGLLRALRDPAIEASEQDLRVGVPMGMQPLTVLMRAERAAFGDAGCGIDWQQHANEPAADEPGASDSVYRGEVCNCQARIRRDAAGQVRSLLLRSAC